MNTNLELADGIPSPVTMVRIIITICLVFPGFVFAQEGEPQKEPTLAELAKQEREKRKDGPEEVRLITNEDLGSMGTARVVTASSTRSSRSRRAAQEDVKDAGEAEKGVSGETAEGEEPDPSTVEYWIPAFQEAIQELKYSVNECLVLELRINNVQNLFFREEDGVQRQMINAELANSVAELQVAREKEREARATVAQLQREARRAGLTLGEVRELTGELPPKRSVMDLSDMSELPE